jgi:hypothetical protein
MSRNPLFGVGGMVPSRSGLLRNHPLLDYLPNHVLYPEQQTANLQQVANMLSPQASLVAAAAAAGHHHHQQQQVENNLLNPMDANSSMPKSKKGAAFHQQPNLPPFKYLHCRDYYAIKGSDRRRISAMMIGVTTDHYGFELDIENQPFSGFKRELRPTNLILQEELLRRAVLSKARVLPRPAQWEKEKIITALKENYPPRMADDDVLFMKMQVRSLVELYWKKKDNAANDSQANSMGWESPKSHLRFYHVLLKKKADLSKIDSDEFWRDAASLMNNLHWTPSSVPMPQIGSSFAETLILPFLFADPITAMELEDKLAEAREKLGGGEYMPPHLHYFMSLIQQNGLDPILFSLPENSIDIQIQSDDESDEESEQETPIWNKTSVVSSSTPSVKKKKRSDSIDKLVVEPRRTPASADVANVAPATIVAIRAVVHQPKTAAFKAPAVHAAASNKQKDIVVVDEEKKYLDSSQLHLRQLELYNSMENEWLALEEKRLTADDSTKNLYDTFSKRKQTSLKTLKRRLLETAEYTGICAKRIHLE